MESAILPGEDGWAATLRSLLDLLSPVARSSAPVRLNNQYIRQAADEVLAAEGLDDLSERLDALAGDGEMWAQLERLAGTSTPPPTTPAEQMAVIDRTALDVASLERVLGANPTRRCVQGHKALKAGATRLLQLVAHLRDALPVTATAEAIPTTRVDTPLDMAYDVRVHPSMRRAIIGGLRTAAAAITIARAEERGERLSPWLALGLANAWAEGPETLASSDAVIDWLVTVVSEVPITQDLGLLLAEWRDNALLSGEKVHFPFDAVDRETH